MEVIVENIKYELDTHNKTAKVMDFIGKVVDVIIPESVECKSKKYKVTEIEDSAFAYCTSLNSVTIPNSVTEIGKWAFYYCKNLETITIGNSVTHIGNSAFYECNSLKSVNIPNGVRYIGEGAFYDCYCLTSIEIPNSVTYIGDSAFGFVGNKIPKRYTEDGKLIAYKAFNADMTCKTFQYEVGKTFEFKRQIKCCIRGFHACTKLLDVFNYYNGEIGTDIVIHEVYLSGDIDEAKMSDSKICSNKIEIGRRLTIEDINEIINRK